MASHNRWHVFLLRSPTAYATTCRVLRHRAIQIQESLAFLRTNDHSSSSSRIVEVGSSGSGASRVVRKGGSCATFFDPTGYGGARDAKGAREATQTASFLGGVQNLLAASFGIGIGGRILAAATPTGVT